MPKKIMSSHHNSIFQIFMLSMLRVFTKSGFKTLDRAQEQGVGRRKNAAYEGECAYFEEAYNTEVGVRWGFETTSNLTGNTLFSLL